MRLPRDVKAFRDALLSVSPAPITIPEFNPPIVGRPGIRPSTRILGNREKIQQLGHHHEYTFELPGGQLLEFSAQLDIDTSDQWRLFGYCAVDGRFRGMLFSVNVTLGHDDSGSVRLQQRLKLVGRGPTPEERAASVDELAARLRRVGLSVTDERDLVLGALDVQEGQFIGTTAAEFIRNFVVAAVIKGHYMENKGYSLPERTSARLTIGKTYSRPELKELFNITDASINNGTFHVKPYRSVWLFITEHKTPDRTQYEDALVGDELRMEGQTEGKTDRLIKDHVALGLELLLFYRKSKKEHLHAAFVYEGPFRYVSHEGARPTKFVLRREREAVAVVTAGTERPFDPNNREDTRARTTAEVVYRPEQERFRQALLSAYGKCAVTECEVAVALEAAHILPHSGVHTDHVKNGLLLRADIHKLFDAGLLAVDSKTKTVRIARALMGSSYQEFDGKKLHLPADDALCPHEHMLDRHRQEAGL